MNFENDPVTGTSIAPFNQRLICSNGMVTKTMNSAAAFNIINTRDSWDHFFAQMAKMDKQKFRPLEFGSVISSKANIRASVAELESARNLIKANSVLNDRELEMYMPYEATEHAYAKNNMDIRFFNKNQKQNAKSAVSYWDLINDITYISSNVKDAGVRNADKLQIYAGGLLSKQPDCANLVKNVF